jgi:hypothetical protein
MVSSVANPRRLGRQAVDVIFRADPLGRGRIRRDKSSSPSLLKPSLKVKRNSAHGKLRVPDRPVSGLNARAPLKVRTDHNVEQILFACPWNSRVRSAVQSATEPEACPQFWGRFFGIEEPEWKRPPTEAALRWRSQFAPEPACRFQDRFAIRRLILAAVVLIVVTLIVFLLAHLPA